MAGRAAWPCGCVRARSRAHFLAGARSVIHAQKSIGQGTAPIIHAALAAEVVREVRNGEFYYVNSAPETPGWIGGHPEWFSPELATEAWELTEAML